MTTTKTTNNPCGCHPLAKINLPRDEALERFEALLGRHSGLIGAAIRKILLKLRGRVETDDLEQAIIAGDLARIESLVSVSNSMTEVDDLALALGKAVYDGARYTSDLVGPVSGLAEDYTIAVGVANPRLAAVVERMTGEQIVQINERTMRTVRRVIRDEVVAGAQPYDIARALRSTPGEMAQRLHENIGLTTMQMTYVENYRRELESGSTRGLKAALKRKLLVGQDTRYEREQRAGAIEETGANSRDGRIIRRALDSETPLSAAQVKKLVERYRKRWLTYRTRTIGRTEAMRALQEAQYALLRSQVDDGRIDERQIVRRWITTNDYRLRDSHADIPLMNPNGVGLDEAFASPLGPVRWPADPAAAPENSINCRCTVFPEILAPELVGL